MDLQNILSFHENGKLTINSTNPIETKEDLSIVYTPGVGKVCMEIANDESLAKEYTIAGKTVAVISDGTAVLGLGDIGPIASLPVMEGKCAIFKEFAGVNAYPIVFNEQDTEKLIDLIKAISINFAAINLEDISAPRCFEIERRLNEELNIPVMHDDQHGTAIVTLAALRGAIKLTGKKDSIALVSGAGAAGYAITKLLLNMKKELSLKEVRVVDSKGLLSTDREDMNKYKMELAELTGQDNSMSLSESLQGTDVFIGVSAKDLINEEMVKTMNNDPIIFAMANPDPEILPDKAKQAGASIVATGRSDFPNQINNALAYPGVFRGLLQGGFNKATDEIKIAAANAIYEYNKEDLSEENLLPSILNKEVADKITESIVNLK